MADAAFRMIGRAIGARSVSGHGPSRIPGRHAGVSCRCLPPLLSIRTLRRRRHRRRSSLAMRRGATRTDGSRDDDEWFYEWTVRVGQESDESFPPAFPQRGVQRIPPPRVAAPELVRYSKKVSGHFMTTTIAIKRSPLLTKVLEMEFLGKSSFIPFIG